MTFHPKHFQARPQPKLLNLPVMEDCFVEWLFYTAKRLGNNANDTSVVETKPGHGIKDLAVLCRCLDSDCALRGNDVLDETCIEDCILGTNSFDRYVRLVLGLVA